MTISFEQHDRKTHCGAGVVKDGRVADLNIRCRQDGLQSLGRE